MGIPEIQKETQKRQRVILRQITTRRIKIAELLAEIDALQDELIETSTDIAIAAFSPSPEVAVR